MVFFCFEKRSAFFALLWCVGFLFLRLHAAEPVGFLDQPLTHSAALHSHGSYDWDLILRDFSSEDGVVTMTYRPPHGPQTTVRVPSGYKRHVICESKGAHYDQTVSMYDAVRRYFLCGVCEENDALVYKPFLCYTLDALFDHAMSKFSIEQRELGDEGPVHKETILAEGYMRKWRVCTPGTPLEANHVRIVCGAVALDGERAPKPKEEPSLLEGSLLPKGSLFPSWINDVYMPGCYEGTDLYKKES